ncbi:quinone oxidoreductase family protein [Spiribacter halobius]|uniref:NADPH:quinone reductase n=1 Tax=Sediminicurvatus halobius TaxID=2182432 RepID=A0A2U2N5T3_9GAMM|nr:quinone oxidoreductase [Spiribacter halobius]PWG64571.1 NADPH:quinone reductase [Spiribacter halobius]UEX79109.1 quinone oxidoreductase [Spiribacter halobius]
MKAVVATDFGGPEVLSHTEVPDPEPGPGEVRVRVVRAGVNFIDVYNRMGSYRKSRTYGSQPPFVLGREGAGTVDAVGEGVTGLAPGDRVAWCLAPGGYAELAVVPAWQLVRIPEGVDWASATTLMLQGGTAHYLASSLFPLRQGHVALVHAGAGGVGRLLIQIARRRGARVLTTVGTREKAAMAEALGAERAILYRETDFAEAVREATGGEGVDVIYDGVGQATYEGDLQCLRRRGALVVFGAASGAVESVNPLELAEAGSIWFTRPHMAHYMASREEIQGRADDLFAWLAAGELTLRIDREFPLAEAAEAHRYLEAGKTTGKLLLRVRDE